MAINLLPTDLAPQRSVGKLVGYVKKFNIIGFSLFIIILIAFLGYAFFLSTQIRASTAQKDQLRTSLSSLEQTEQSVVLLKDRIAKGKTLIPLTESYNNAQVFQELSFSITPDTSIREVKLTPLKTELVLLFTSSSTLVNFVSSIAQNEAYQRIEIASFSFNPTFGYLVNFSLIN